MVMARTVCVDVHSLPFNLRVGGGRGFDCTKAKVSFLAFLRRAEAGTWRTRGARYARGGDAWVKEKETHEYILFLTWVSRIVLSQIASKTQKKAAPLYTQGGDARINGKKDTKIMFLSRVSHLVLFRRLSDPERTWKFLAWSNSSLSVWSRSDLHYSWCSHEWLIQFPLSLLERREWEVIA